jgi:hypothetical protein
MIEPIATPMMITAVFMGGKRHSFRASNILYDALVLCQR